MTDNIINSIPQFVYGEQERYDKRTKNPQDIHFTSDTRRIYVGEKDFSKPLKQPERWVNLRNNTNYTLTSEEDSVRVQILNGDGSVTIYFYDEYNVQCSATFDGNQGSLTDFYEFPEYFKTYGGSIYDSKGQDVSAYSVWKQGTVVTSTASSYQVSYCVPEIPLYADYEDVEQKLKDLDSAKLDSPTVLTVTEDYGSQTYAHLEYTISGEQLSQSDIFFTFEAFSESVEGVTISEGDAAWYDENGIYQVGNKAKGGASLSIADLEVGKEYRMKEFLDFSAYSSVELSYTGLRLACLSSSDDYPTMTVSAKKKSRSTPMQKSEGLPFIITYKNEKGESCKTTYNLVAVE